MHITDAGSVDPNLNEILGDPQNFENLNSLREEIKRYNGIIPFVGAGLSVPLGFPGWTQFLRDEARKYEIEDEMTSLLASAKHEKAADLLRDTLGMVVFENAIEREFGERRLPEYFSPDLAVRMLPRLSSGPVVTTNFDRVLERAFEQESKPFAEVVLGPNSDFMTRALRTDRRSLLKMHGDVLDRKNRILTLKEYENSYGSEDAIDFEKPLPRLLKRLFENKPVLFLGCSLGPDRTLRVLQTVAQESNVRHYALVDRPGDQRGFQLRGKFLADQGICPIWFPQGRYDLIPPLLNYLAGLRPNPIPPPPPPPDDSRRTGAGTGKAPFCDQYAWDYDVHKRLQEQLVYYLVRIRPYNRRRAIQDLKDLIKQESLGTVRAFELLGPHDLLIRAWIYSTIAPGFQELLLKHLKGCRSAHPFSAQRVTNRWYRKSLDQGQQKLRQTLLNRLDRPMIEAVQAGEHPAALEELVNLNLSFDRTPEVAETITFFVAVNLPDPSPDNLHSVTAQLADYFRTEESRFHRITIDTGFGFCSVFIKGEVKEFFSIGDLAASISETFKGYEATTETYVSVARSQLIGDGCIGQSTFDEIEGRNLFVEAMVPGVYPKRTALHSDVERFVIQHRETRNLGPDGKLFLQKFLGAILRKSEADSATALFRVFFDWEGFLRENHRKFLGKLGKNPSEIYQKLQLDGKPWEEYTLLEVLTVCSHGVKGTKYEQVVGTDWRELTKVRNVGIHKKKDLGAWEAIATVMVEHWGRMSELVKAVEAESGEKFKGLFADSEDEVT
jgi:hypothetical protein